MLLGFHLKLALAYLFFLVRKDFAEPQRATSLKYIKGDTYLAEELKRNYNVYPSSHHQHHSVPIATDIHYSERSPATALTMNGSTVSDWNGSSFIDQNSPNGQYRPRRVSLNGSGRSEGPSYLHQYKEHVAGDIVLPHNQTFSRSSNNQGASTSSDRDTTQRRDQTVSDELASFLRVKTDYAAKGYRPLTTANTNNQDQNLGKMSQLGPFAKYLSSPKSITSKGLFSRRFSSTGSLEISQSKPSIPSVAAKATADDITPDWSYQDMPKSESYEAKLFDSHLVTHSPTNPPSRPNLLESLVLGVRRTGKVQWLVIKPCSVFSGAKESVPCRADLSSSIYQPSADQNVSKRKIFSQFQASTITDLHSNTQTNPGIVPNMTQYVNRGSMRDVPPSEVQSFQVAPIIRPPRFPTSVGYQTSKSLLFKNIGDSRGLRPQALPATVSTPNTKVPSIDKPVGVYESDPSSTVKSHLSMTSGQISKTSSIDAIKTPRRLFSASDDGMRFVLNETTSMLGKVHSSPNIAAAGIDRTSPGSWSPSSQLGSIQRHQDSRESSVFTGSVAPHYINPVQTSTSVLSKPQRSPLSPGRVFAIKGEPVSERNMHFAHEATKYESRSQFFRPQKAKVDKNISIPTSLKSVTSQSEIRHVQAKIINIQPVANEGYLDSRQMNLENGELGHSKYMLKYNSHVNTTQRPTSSVVVVKRIKTKDNRNEFETQNHSETGPVTYSQSQSPTYRPPIVRRKHKSKTANVSMNPLKDNATSESQGTLNQGKWAQNESLTEKVEVVNLTNGSKPVRYDDAAQTLSSSQRKPITFSDVAGSASFSIYKPEQEKPVLQEMEEYGNSYNRSYSSLEQTVTAAAREQDVQSPVNSGTSTTDL